ncbi:MAG: tripartite tricarboxylate transporter substrate binding protein, partial [Nitratireductor sp.]
FKKNHPEAFQKMVDAYKAVLEDEAFVKSLKEQKIGAEWLGPERTTEIINSNFDVLKRFDTEE